MENSRCDKEADFKSGTLTGGTTHVSDTLTSSTVNDDGTTSEGFQGTGASSCAPKNLPLTSTPLKDSPSTRLEDLSQSPIKTKQGNNPDQE